MKIVNKPLARTDKAVAPTAQALVKKPGVEDVIAVIDVSYSMGDQFKANNHVTMNRIQAVVEALHMILDSSSRLLTRFGLIEFHTRAEILQLKTDRFTNVKAAAMRLEPKGSTNMAEGIGMALAQEPDRIILLSDGEANDRGAVLARVAEAAERKVKIDTVGIGDAGLELLRSIAEKTGGVYMFADNLDKLRETFMKLETRARLLLEHKS